MERVSGPMLARELRGYLARVGMTERAMSIVSGIPEQTLGGLARVGWPLASTAARIRGYIAAHPDGVSQADVKAAAMRRAAQQRSDDEALPPRLWREPCPRCGVRADHGCAHSRPVPWDVTPMVRAA